VCDILFVNPITFSSQKFSVLAERKLISAVAFPYDFTLVTHGVGRSLLYISDIVTKRQLTSADIT
jgi:hypothetical protein